MDIRHDGKAMVASAVSCIERCVWIALCQLIGKSLKLTVGFVGLVQMAVQKMEASDADSHLFAHSFHDVEDAVVSTACEENSIDEKGKLMVKCVCHISAFSITN